MDWQKIGKFIAELRKENGMTQADLCKRLYTSRENISKWERGVNNPTTETLIELSKIFDVSVNELLAGERKTDVNGYQIDNISAKVLKEKDEKVKRILIRSIIIIVGILLIFFIYYFINTYNTIYVYKIYGKNSNFESSDGLVIFSKNKSYLKLGDITSEVNLEYDKVELFYYDKNKGKHIIYSTDDDNFIVLASYRNNDLFSYDHMKEIINNTYLKIEYQDKEDEIKLTFARDMHNSFHIFNNNDENIDNYIEENNSKDTDIPENKFEYDEENGIYVYNGKNKDFEFKIEYSEMMGSYTVREYKDDGTYVFDYNIFTNLLNINVVDSNQEAKYFYTYNYQDKKCLEGSCDMEQINYFFEDYYNKYQVEK